jgi:protein-tyrosine phosphatase
MHSNGSSKHTNHADERNPPVPAPQEIPFTPPQLDRLRRFGAARCVDIHCHCLPGVDDGPKTGLDAVALCRALVADGITTAVATPHQLGRYDRRNAGGEVRQAVADLNAVLAREGVPLSVVPGADVRVDERLPELLGAGHVLTLADAGKFVLLELPHETYIEPLPLIRLLVGRGVRPIVSHPERHEHVSKKPELVVPWLKHGALLQVTAGSLAGDFGGSAERCAWGFLKSSAVAFIASDAHGATRRPPRMSAAIELIERQLGRAVAARVCVENPARVLGAAEPKGWGRRSNVTGAGAISGAVEFAGGTIGSATLGEWQ